MAILSQEALQLAQAVRQAMIALRTLVNGNQLSLGDLTTADKSNLVAAINEVKAAVSDVDLSGYATTTALTAGLAGKQAAGTYATGTGSATGTNTGDQSWASLGGGGTIASPSVTSLTASGNIEAATYTRGGVAQQDVGTGASPTFASINASGTVTAAGVINTRYNIGVGSTLTLALTDNGGTRECGHAVGTVITVPLQSSVAWPSNSIIRIRRGTAAGPVTFAGGGVTIQGAALSAMVYPGGSLDLIRVSSDVWRVDASLGGAFSGNVDAPSYSRGGVAQQDVKVGASLALASVTATADPSGDTSVITRKYSTAKGPNLIANGSGGMGSNYNFPDFTFDPADVAVGKGSFKSNVYNAVAYSAEYIPIDNQRSYVLSGYGKSGNRDGSEYNPATIQYLGVALFDADYLPISTQSILQWPGSTLTTLAASLNPGDTTVTLTDATGWCNTSRDLARHFAWWPFTNSLGYTWDNYTYSGPNITRKSGSPYLSAGTWAAGGISGNVITLSAPWPFAALPAGTPVRNSDEGATYKYIAAAGVAVPTTWTKYEGVLGPVDPTGLGAVRSWIGSSYMRILFLRNFTASGNVIRWSGLNLRAMDSVPRKTVYELSNIPPEAGMQYFCTNASGGASMVFGDGTNWRKPTTSILT